MNKFKSFINDMKTYDDYKTNKDDEDLTDEEFGKINWTRYKIIVPTENDRKELMSAFKHIHNSNINTNFIIVNQLVHEYQNSNNIIVDENLFNKIKGDI